ncbi:unnamed protein product [Dibothriocephalus latus]|uniref:Tyrosine specific protein phosphatases domain-containing protein n=1 Tax=Dibothriocephalus latus TaxID=60516 RepID=A0A3P7PK76_DIBLA|nr:unnamed protein product [Dibothriocephalus latus]
MITKPLSVLCSCFWLEIGHATGPNTAGRTGVMVCACLMEMQEAKDAADALHIYAERRTRNGQGVTIPSQRRYVDYYSRLINGSLSYEPTPLRLVAIRVEGLQHHLHGIQSKHLLNSTLSVW